jgi:hypothetical protein
MANMFFLNSMVAVTKMASVADSCFPLERKSFTCKHTQCQAEGPSMQRGHTRVGTQLKKNDAWKKTETFILNNWIFLWIHK